MKQIVLLVALAALVSATTFTCPIGGPAGFYCLDDLPNDQYYWCSVPDFAGARPCAPGSVCTGAGYHATNPCKTGDGKAPDPCKTCTLLPVISAPPAVTRQCGSSLSPSVTGEPTVSAPCGIVVTVNFADDKDVSTGCHTGITITRTWTVTDSCGRTNTATQEISLTGFQCPAAHENGFWCQHSEHTDQYYQCTLPFFQGWRPCPAGTQCVKAGFQTGVPCLTGPLQPANHYCGDGNCDSDETCASCPNDCPASLPKQPEDFSCGSTSGFYCFAGDHVDMYYQCSPGFFQGWRECPSGTYCSTDGFNAFNPCTTQKPTATCSH